MQIQPKSLIIIGGLATALVMGLGLASFAFRKNSSARQRPHDGVKAQASEKLLLKQAKVALVKENAALAEESQALVDLRDACLSLRALINASYPAL
ncbi:MAG: hypothetical protein QNJ46_28850 [Leptolyngbyaceae cyanobacterium MO_188.B28]|nr:hypothetical protein [Leptolyngbyaceae cyanobacterium MO_188.B28]